MRTCVAVRVKTPPQPGITDRGVWWCAQRHGDQARSSRRVPDEQHRARLRAAPPRRPPTWSSASRRAADHHRGQRREPRERELDREAENRAPASRAGAPRGTRWPRPIEHEDRRVHSPARVAEPFLAAVAHEDVAGEHGHQPQDLVAVRAHHAGHDARPAGRRRSAAWCWS